MSTKKSGAKSHGDESWFKERDKRREAGGAAPGTDEQPFGPEDNQRPIGSETDDRQIGQYSGEGAPPLQKR